MRGMRRHIQAGGRSARVPRRGCACSRSPSRAEAAEARRRFDIPPKPYAEALIDLAVQANVSLLGASACGAGGRASLSRPLHPRRGPGADCWPARPAPGAIVDAGTVRILPLAAASPPARQVGPAAPAGGRAAGHRPQAARSGSTACPPASACISGEQLRATGAGDVRDTAGQLVGRAHHQPRARPRQAADARPLRRRLHRPRPLDRRAPTSTTPRSTTTPPTRTCGWSTSSGSRPLRGPQGALYGSGRAGRRLPHRHQQARPSHASPPASPAPRPGPRAARPATRSRASSTCRSCRTAPRCGWSAYYDVQGGYLDDVSLRLSNVDSHHPGRRSRWRCRVAAQRPLDARRLRRRSSACAPCDTQYTTGGLKAGLRANRAREATTTTSPQGVDRRAAASWAAPTSPPRPPTSSHDFASLYDATAAAGDLRRSRRDDLGVYSERARIRRLVQDVVLTSSGDGPVPLAGRRLRLGVARAHAVLPAGTAQPSAPARRRLSPRAAATGSHDARHLWRGELPIRRRLDRLGRRPALPDATSRPPPRSSSAPRRHSRGRRRQPRLRRLLAQALPPVRVRGRPPDLRPVLGGLPAGGINSTGFSDIRAAADHLRPRPAAQLRGRRQGPLPRRPPGAPRGRLLRRLDQHPVRPVPALGPRLHRQRRRRPHPRPRDRGRLRLRLRPVAAGQRPLRRSAVHPHQSRFRQTALRLGPAGRAARVRRRARPLRAAAGRRPDPAAGRPRPATSAPRA